MFRSEREKTEYFNAIFKKYYNNVVYFLLHYVDSYEEAQDVASETFSQMWQNLEHYQDSIFPRLIVIARNKCLNYLRKEKHKREHLQYELSMKNEINYQSLNNSAIEGLLEKDTRATMLKVLDTMPEKTKEAFILSRFQNKTYAEIAQMQNVSEKNIEYRISSALKILKRVMIGVFILWTSLNC